MSIRSGLTRQQAARTEVGAEENSTLRAHGWVQWRKTLDVLDHGFGCSNRRASIACRDVFALMNHPVSPLEVRLVLNPGRSTNNLVAGQLQPQLLNPVVVEAVCSNPADDVLAKAADLLCLETLADHPTYQHLNGRLREDDR